MALTIPEQLDIIDGTEAPLNNTLEELISQIALNEAQDINDDAKSFDAYIEPLADAYIRKMLALASTSLAQTISIGNLTRLLVAIYADTGTIAEVQGATDAQWVTFLENNITKTFELIAGVRNAEKIAYDALP